MSVQGALLEAWARGELPLRDLLGVPAEAITAARQLGERCLALGDGARAEAIFAGLSALDPSDPDPALALATLTLERGAPDVALAWAERTLRLRPCAELASIASRARVALELRRRHSMG